MSKQKLKDASPTTGIDEVLAYLKSNPNTVAQHPQILEYIQLSDEQDPGVASLIEKQAAVLREKVAKMHRQTDDLIVSARENESIHDRVFDLAIEVMRETSIDNLLSNLYN
ncbi:MAG: DUF484 family protein, partial [Proteobacteria bacterium]|nr:DUF484 family protein [Pseudomonadota bacterium]